MLGNDRVLALIPARGGSKGLPDKNIMTLGGQSLIGRTLTEARKVEAIDSIHVSTDSQKIAAHVKTLGCQVNQLRPSHLAEDGTSMKDVLLYELTRVSADFDLFILLQPTSPLRTAVHISEAMRLMQERHADAVVSVCRCDHHPWLANTLPADGSMRGFLREEAKFKNRQEWPPYYRLNGAIFVSRIATFLKNPDWFSLRAHAYVMSAEDSLDIDTPADALAAAAALKARSTSLDDLFKKIETL